MQRIVSPHDRFFKAVMTDIRVAKDFFKNHLPESVLQQIDLDSLTLCKETFVDPSLSLLMSDVLYSVNLRGDKNTPIRKGYLYLLCEHQGKPEELMPFRLLEYTVKIMRQHISKTKENVLPVVYPIVFYNGKNAYSYSTDIFDLFGPYRSLAEESLLKFQLIDLTQIPDDVLNSSPWTGLFETIMKHIRARDFLLHLKKSAPMIHLIAKEGGEDYVLTVLNYCAETGEVNDKEAFIDFIKHDLPNSLGEEAMTIAEMFRKEGRQEGRQEGKREGIKEVALKLLKKGMDLQSIAEITQLPICELSQEEIQ
jgi:predicted transposase/invertase (TIGR01784 family)